MQYHVREIFFLIKKKKWFTLRARYLVNWYKKLSDVANWIESNLIRSLRIPVFDAALIQGRMNSAIASVYRTRWIEVTIEYRELIAELRRVDSPRSIALMKFASSASLGKMKCSPPRISINDNFCPLETRVEARDYLLSTGTSWNSIF